MYIIEKVSHKDNVGEKPNCNIGRRSGEISREEIKGICNKIIILLHMVIEEGQEDQKYLLQKLEQGIFLVEYMLAVYMEQDMKKLLIETIHRILQCILSQEDINKTRAAISIVLEKNILSKFSFLLHYYYNEVIEEEYFYFYLARVRFSFPDLYQAAREEISKIKKEDWYDGI